MSTKDFSGEKFCKYGGTIDLVFLHMASYSNNDIIKRYLEVNCSR